MLQNLIDFVHVQFGVMVQCVRSYNGGEFQMLDYYVVRDIIHQKSCVAMPLQNGIVEHKHRHIMNVACALKFNVVFLIHIGVNAHAVYLINRTLSPMLNQLTIYEKLFQIPPLYSHLKIFGCLCYVSTHDKYRYKFDCRSDRCVFLGYQNSIK